MNLREVESSERERILAACARVGRRHDRVPHEVVRKNDRNGETLASELQRFLAQYRYRTIPWFARFLGRNGNGTLRDHARPITTRDTHPRHGRGRERQEKTITRQT